MEKDKPNYYSIIPAEVRYSKDISSTAKLIYAEISSLSNKEGFCWANNRYFSDLFDITKIQISYIMSKLQKRGFIKIEIDQQNGNSRKIYLNTYQIKPYDLLKKSLIPIKEKFKHNNKDNIKYNNINISFISFWDLYKKKNGLKSKVENKWNSLTDKDRKDIIDYVPKYIQAQPDKQFRKHPMTFLNNESWKDELISNNKPKKRRVYFQGDPVYEKNGKQWVVSNGEWREFVGEQKDLEIKFE